MNHIVREFFDCYANHTLSYQIGTGASVCIVMNREAGLVDLSRLYLLLSEGARDDVAGNSQC